MRRRANRYLVQSLIRLRKIHHKIGRMAEYSHLTYFGVLVVEGWQKTMYAKVGIVCLVCSILYLISEDQA